MKFTLSILLPLVLVEEKEERERRETEISLERYFDESFCSGNSLSPLCSSSVHSAALPLFASDPADLFIRCIYMYIYRQVHAYRSEKTHAFLPTRQFFSCLQLRGRVVSAGSFGVGSQVLRRQGDKKPSHLRRICITCKIRSHHRGLMCESKLSILVCLPRLYPGLFRRTKGGRFCHTENFFFRSEECQLVKAYISVGQTGKLPMHAPTQEKEHFKRARGGIDKRCVTFGLP